MKARGQAMPGVLMLSLMGAMLTAQQAQSLMAQTQTLRRQAMLAQMRSLAWTALQQARAEAAQAPAVGLPVAPPARPSAGSLNAWWARRAQSTRLALVSETDPGFEFEAGYWRESWQAPAPTQPKAAAPAGALHRLTVWVRDPQTQARGVWQGLWQAGEPVGSQAGWWSVQVIDE